MSQRQTVISLFAVTVVAIGIGIVIGTTANTELFAAGEPVADPNGVAPDRYVYYPGTEALAPDEMRIIACGTGMPAARRGQAASCWVFELGNGDKFLIDLGTGSMATDMMVWNLTRGGVTERMAVSSDEAWDVEGTEPGLEPDPTRKPEIVWPELINQRLDMTEVDKSWLVDYKKKYNLE